jgi:hypothetical protein
MRVCRGCNLPAPVLRKLMEIPTKIFLNISASNYGSDGARIFARNLQLGVWPECHGVVIDCGVQVAALLGLVLALLRRVGATVAPFGSLSISLLGMNAVVKNTLLAQQRSLVQKGLVRANADHAFTPTAIPPLELALLMASYCQVWYHKLPMFSDTLGEYAELFDV